MTATASMSLTDRVEELITSGEFQLPPVPQLAVRLQTALEDETTDSRAVANLIRTEPAIAVSLLRTANSAAFGGLKPISDLPQAVARLGLKRVRGHWSTRYLSRGSSKPTESRINGRLRRCGTTPSQARPWPETWRLVRAIRQRRPSWPVFSTVSVG